ncbi:prephenate dehydrogenase [Sporolactobacillus terrae]|uniref:prephenate dehydrogenase n=1 Tax=Sporolactobacillus terrae TaxID=269673 RepID=UPI00048EF62C|nr:prephenate dehydrogenase [Sporolactobacillus terrae]
MKTILIDGLGLIGGSIALAIRKKWPDERIVAVDVSPDVLEHAKRSGIIDEGSLQLNEVAANADVIVLSAPVGIIIDHIKTLAELSLKPEVIVTDVGSTKQAIMQHAQKLTEKKVIFIGGHPMAGWHKTTIRAARADLFQSAYYFLINDTLIDERHQAAARALQELLSELSVKWLTVSASRHDRIVAQISHLPHILASGLVNMSQNEFRNSPLSLKLAAGGFKSITRIASSDPTMWTDILLSNRETLIDKIDRFSQCLDEVRQALAASDRESIRTFFKEAKVTRDNLNAQTGAHAPNFYDLFLNLPDCIGSLARVTRILENAKINLVNIHILEIREDVAGVLQLSFSNQEDRLQAKCELDRHGLPTIRGDQ